MNKPFVEDGPTGINHRKSAAEVADMVDESPATRLTLILHQKGILSDREFLDIIRPRSSIRLAEEYDPEE